MSTLDCRVVSPGCKYRCKTPFCGRTCTADHAKQVQGIGNDKTWPIVVNQIELNETAREEIQSTEMEEAQRLTETQAREQPRTGPARARKKPGWLKDFIV